MELQHQIKRTLSQPQALNHIQGLLALGNPESRSVLAKQLCDDFGLFDPRGQRQMSGCLKALRELERSGSFVLPPPLSTGGPGSPRGLSSPVPMPSDLPERADHLSEFALIVVQSQDHLRIWNQMMSDEHPRGAGPLVGRQLRYLLRSSQGFLGGLGFAAAALQMADRDRWIGWTVEQRREVLHYLVNLSRFLIRPGIACKNLASQALGMCLRQLPLDFERLYGYQPVLVESFVDTTSFSGTTYRAANWLKVGQTRGRGRQDLARQEAETIKDIYVYPLEKDFRARLGLAADSGLGPLGICEGLDGDDWVDKEFRGAPLGDARLSRRLVLSAKMQADKPGSAFTGAAGGDWAAARGYYRLIDMPETSGVTPENILAPHRERTVRRMKDQRVVLCVQDGTDLNYTNLAKCEGLGDLGSNQTGAVSKGLHMHSLLALSIDGLPLGVLSAQCVAPEPKSSEDKRPSYAIPIEEKKTFSWVGCFRDLVGLKEEMPHTRLITICDREADFFELFDEQRQSGRVDLLVRAKHNRSLMDGSPKLFESLRQAPVEEQLKIQVDRQSARPKRSKQKARAARVGREAVLSLRYKRVQLKPAKYSQDKGPLSVWAIHVLEETPPEGAEPVEWFLLTTVELRSAEEAIECLRWYCLRWRIEDWHRVIKSGCKIEDLAFETAEGLRRAIMINLVIGWRIMLMTLMGRETPELKAEVLFSDIELEVLQAYARKRRLKVPVLLGEAVRLVARMGGYLARKNDPPPGHQLMWQGWLQLSVMCMGYALRDP